MDPQLAQPPVLFQAFRTSRGTSMRRYSKVRNVVNQSATSGGTTCVHRHTIKLGSL